MFRMEQVEAIFHEALALAPEVAIARWLEVRCHDSAIRDEVLSLLEAHQAMKRDTGYSGSPDERGPREITRHNGRFGCYRIEHLLGTGGMGAVYLARRDDGEFNQLVAIKLIGLHVAGQEFLSNLRNERQVLASLNHPNITRLLDAGVSDTGEPYMVMEYVDGEPLDDYCEHRQLTIACRLELFQQVCSAVDYAHRNLVVHRDLKPGNIFVDSNGAVKLLDFGTAKLLRDQDATVTRMGPVTPRYASPEQLRGELVTTASDVFSMGVVLYELLTGRWPFGDPKSTVDALDRVLRYRPATSPAFPVTERAAQDRSITPERLARELSGDLSTIVLKMLEPDPAQRYGSVREVADDLIRYHGGRPILARPQTMRYAILKFVTRHWISVSAATAGLIVLAGLTIFSMVEWSHARQQAERAQRISEFVKRTFLSASSTWRSPLRGQSREIQFRDVLDSAVTRVDSELGNDPEAEADMRGTLGMTYALLGDPALGQAQLTKAIAQLAKSKDADPYLAPRLALQLCDALSYQGLYQQALKVCRDGLRLARGTRYPELGSLLHDTAFMAVKSGEPLADAEKLYREALAYPPPEKSHEKMQDALVNTRIGSLRIRQGDLAEGEHLLAAAEAFLQSEPGPPIEIIPTLVARAAGERVSGHYAEAVKRLRQGIALLDQRPTPYMGRDQVDVELAATEALAGKPEALSRWREHAGMLKSAPPADLIRLEMLGGTVEGLMGDRTTAVRYLRDAIAVGERETPRQPGNHVEAFLRLAQVLTSSGDRDEAAKVAKRGLVVAAAAYGTFFATHPMVAQLRSLQ